MLRIFILYCAAVSIQAFSKPSKGTEDLLPLVINTWNYSIANEEAWRILNLVPGGRHQTRNAVVGGINKCEREQCEFNVGYGGTPDELGETTLDAMVMDGSNMNVGAVAGLTDINDAILAARYVLEHTEHSLLVGQGASDFAVAMGLNRSATLATPRTKDIWTKWKAKNCQPNFWTNVTPDAKHSCGPYVPNAVPQIHQRDRSEMNIGLNNHDTISLAAIDVDHQIHSATSTNGLNFKMHGRVGDSPIVGAGNYADNEVGFALSTGDGDIALRFLPTFQAVEQMRLGKTPAEAVKIVMQRIKKYYKKYFGALIAVDRLGNYACECSGWKQFPFIVSSPRQNDRLEIINCSVEIENPEVPLLKAN